MPILAVTSSVKTARQLRSSWGVVDVLLSDKTDMNDLTEIAIARLKQTGLVETGDAVVIMAGSHGSGQSTTDTVRMTIVN